MWSYLERYLELSGGIWKYQEVSGGIWKQLEVSGSLNMKSKQLSIHLIVGLYMYKLMYPLRHIVSIEALIEPQSIQ